VTTATPDAGVTVRKDNPLCGDEIELTVTFGSGRIGAAAHRARACSLANASARLLAETVRGLTAAEARELASRVDHALRGANDLPAGFESIASVLLMPSRKRCVLLPWEALAEALLIASATPAELGA
jgi:nitrogen fixation NifU-like protein